MNRSVDIVTLKHFCRISVLTQIATAGFAVSFPAPSIAQGVDRAALFGQRETVSDVGISPAGTHVVYISPSTGQGSEALVAELGSASAPKRVLIASGNPERLAWCRWASEARIVCLVYFVQDSGSEILSSTRLISVSASGGDVKLLTRRAGEKALGHAFYGGGVIDWLPDEEGAVLMEQVFIPEARIGSLVEKRQSGIGVERVDVSTLQRKRIVDPDVLASDYITDGRGNTRIRGSIRTNPSGYMESTATYHYRKKGQTNWLLLDTYDYSSTVGFSPSAVDAEQDVVFGFRKKDGRWALYKKTLDGSEQESLVYAHPDVDISGLIRIGKQRRVIGLTYITDRRRSVYFDPAFADLRQKLSKALGAGVLVDIVDSSIDEQKLVLFVSRDVDSGKYYLFDRKTRQLGEILPVRPGLESVALAPVKPVTVLARDGVQIPAYLTLPSGGQKTGFPAIVLPHGGPDARDEWGFDWLSQYFASQGYAVLQPNFRGSGGYGDDWLQANGFQSWRSAINDVIDSGKWLVGQGIARPDGLAILGWSYGGYAALQSAAIEPSLYKAVIAIAPVTDFDLLRRQYSNFANRQLVADYIGSGPHILEGSPAKQAARITAPVLMFHGTLDRNVEIGHSKRMEAALQGGAGGVKLVAFKELDHNLEDSVARATMLRESDAFLRLKLGLPAPK